MRNTSHAIVCPEIINDFDEKTKIKNSKENDFYNIIFLGNTNFSERKIDDISNIIKKLASAGFKVYIQESQDTKKLCLDNVNVFNPFSFKEILNGDLLSYISSFDAVLYSYSTVNEIRYNNSVTTRLLLSEGSGVPVYTNNKIPELIKDEVYRCRY
ncbi:hypothetical protein [Photobacterium leiognathi]|uniref:hypothetical protein n=1 Tax=Photobacterium leiognathi TaxID=553611 RepID=UPI0027366726|nr:hypothetical protein [Photobacterium leiognathi]